MSVAGTLNLVAWLLSALIAAWLIVDMVRVSRADHDGRLLALRETLDDPTLVAGDPTGIAEKGERA